MYLTNNFMNENYINKIIYFTEKILLDIHLNQNYILEYIQL
jgi:hypothetical protein